LAGSFAMANADGTRGLEGAIEGELALKAGKLSSFRAFARTAAWGAGTYTPRPPAGKFPVLFAFQVVNDEAARLVPPQGNLWGNEYREAKLAP
ncbi:MAG TPA: hypothetical protein VEX38_08345, partial [Fimbriimonadaceae bacterium]|nr:hypothetical protein [Fimbriimonadaceae bacterium]